MKTKILYRLAIAIAFTGVLYACKKSSSSSSTTTTTADMSVQTDDESRVSNETDAVTVDANTAMLSQSSVSGASVSPVGRYGVTTDGGGADSAAICDATITVDTANSTKTITITYNGSTCNLTRTRTGTVVISIPAGTRWSEQGAVVTLSIQNLKITRLIDNKTITLNGTHTYTNVSGGSLANLPNLQSITHTVTSSNMQITFDDGTQRTWQLARQHVFTYSNNAAVISTTGTHSDGTHSGVSEWGTTRFGISFVTEISEPLVIAEGCAFRLTSGQVTFIRPDITATLTFGLDSAGIAAGCPLTGSFYYEAVWMGANGKSVTVIAPY